jgi:hypothetical protein
LGVNWINVALDRDNVDKWRIVIKFRFHKMEGFFDCVRNSQLLQEYFATWL